jgi:hypothetical protein
VEEAIEHVFQHRAIGRAGDGQRGEPFGISFVAGNVLAREVVKPGDVLCLILREFEDFGKASTSFSLTMPSALAIFADSAMIATEKATLRRVSGSPSKTVRIASTTADSALPAVLPMAFNSFSQKDIENLTHLSTYRQTA